MLLSIILVDLFFLSRSNVKYSTHERLGTGGFAKEGVAFLLILNPRVPYPVRIFLTVTTLN